VHNFSTWDWQRIPRHARRTGAIVLAILVAWVLFLWLFDWSPLTGPLASLASHALHRKVQIGRFSAHLLHRSPTISVQDLRIANASWVKSGRDLAQIPRVSTAIDLGRLFGGHVVLSLLEIDDPRLDLESDAQGRASWEFNAEAENPANKKPAGKLPHLPAVTLFTVRGGSLKINDAEHKLHFEGSVAANENAAHPELEPLRIQGHGELNGEPFDLTFQGSALFNLRVDRPYSFATEVRAGPMVAKAQGEIDKPFDLAHFGAALDVHGDNLAGLYYLTGLALPFTPPFQFSGHMRNDGGHFGTQDMRARIGQSDMQGTLAIDSTGVRPLLTGDLISHALNLSDLAPTLGAGVPNESGKDSLQAPASQPAPTGLLPDYKFEFDRLRAMDAQLKLRADAVKASSVPIKALTINLHLKEGVLSIDPLDFTLPQGHLTGAVGLDTQHGTGLTALDLRMQNVDLAQFKGAKMASAPIDGTLLSRIQLKGEGNSVHQMLASADGTITAIIPHGDIRQAFAELTGINVAQGLGLLLTGSQKQSTINCGIAAFRVQHGVARAEPIDISTSTVEITGSGDFDFDSEKLHIELHGQPKKLSPLRVRAPILIGGTFAKPSIGLVPGTLLAQAGVAAVLGAVATPAAAVLAFVDPGLSKNKDCEALLSGPQARSTEHPGPPKANPPKTAPHPSSAPPSEAHGAATHPG
jgi:uncharacterized protein involved in outer membrane biogenesis